MNGHLHWIAAAVLGASLLGVAGARAASSFPDPVGDVTGGRGPDLTAVSVSHTSTTVTFRVRFAQAPPLRVSVAGKWIDMLLIGIDVPPRGAKPSPVGWRGADYWAGLHGKEASGLLVKGPRWTSLGRLRVLRQGRTLSISIARRLLGNPASFDFAVFAGREGSDESAGGGSDAAPANGTFHYRLGG